MLIAFGVSIRYGLDITDEAVHYYLLKFGPEVHYNHVAFGIFHYLGALWGHSALGYRWLSLILLGSTGMNFALSIHRYLRLRGVELSLTRLDIAALAWLSSFGFLDVLPISPHYNTFVFVFLLNSLAFFFWSLNETPTRQSLYSGLTAVFILGSWCSKPPSGVLNLLLILVLAYSHRKRLERSFFVVGAIALFIASLLTYLVFDWNHTFAIAKSLTQTAHRPWQLIWSYFVEAWHFLLRQVLPVFGVLVAVLSWGRAKPQQARFVLPIIWLGLVIWWVNPLFRSESAYTWSRNSAAIAAALMLLCFWIRDQHRPLARHLGFCLFINLAAGLACAFGTNNSLTNWTGATMVLWAPLALSVLQARLGWSRPVLFLWCLPLLLSQVLAFYVARVQHPHRQAPLAKQTARFTDPGPLHGLYLEPEFVELIKKLNQELSSKGFDSVDDQILAAYEIPGIVLALNARAMGQPRYQDGIYNVEQLNCDILDIEWTRPKRNVFVVLTMPLNPVFEACVNKYIDLPQNAWDETPAVGELKHYRNDTVYPVKVLGPFAPKAD
jgi:hypothetical protein